MKSRLANDIVGRFPPGWKAATIGELGELVAGSTPPRKEDERYFSDSGIPWVKTGDLTNGLVSRTEERITDLGVSECRCPKHPPGTVLVAMYGGFGQIGRTGLLNIHASTNQAITAIRLRDPSPVTPIFLQAWLNHVKPVWRRVAGSSRKDPNISKSDISNLPVPLPPDALVRAHDSFVSAVGLMDEKIAELIAAKRLFKEGVVQTTMLTTRCERSMSMAQLCEQVVNRNAGRLSYDRVMGVVKGVGFESMRNRVRGKGGLDRYLVVPPGAFAYNPMRLNIGSIAFNNQRRELLVSPDYVVFQPRAGVASAKYVNQLRYAYLWRRFMRRAGAGSVRVRIYFDDLARLRFPAPDIHEQERIATALDVMDREISLLEAQRKQYQLYKSGLMNSLLSGELTVPS